MRLIDADAVKKQINQMQILKWSDKNLLRLAVDRTSTYEPPNDPLTLEQLREMDGAPVWCTFSEGRDCYIIVQWHNSEFFRSFECGFLLAEDYGKGWLAYRRKPEEQPC